MVSDGGPRGDEVADFRSTWTVEGHRKAVLIADVEFAVVFGVDS